MFKPCFQSTSRLLPRPLFKDPSLSPLHGYGTRRFFRGPFGKRHRARVPLVIAISACTIGIVGLVGLAVDKYGPQGLAPFTTPFETVKPHLQKIFSRNPDADQDQTLKLPSAASIWAGDRDRTLSEAELQQVLVERLHMREMFQRARSSGSQEELRKACFSVILFMTENGKQLEVIDPLAPLPPESRFAGEGALFDMATETRVYRQLQPDGTLQAVFLVVNADLDQPIGDVHGFDQFTEAFINQFEVWQRERHFQFGAKSFVPVVLVSRESVVLMRYAPMWKQISLDGYWDWSHETEEEIRLRQAREGKSGNSAPH